MSKTRETQEKANKKNQYRSVTEMVRATADDPAFAKGVQRKIAERNLINFLMGLRAAAGLSQAEIATRMKCTQSRISKLENGKDDDLRIGDFHAYADALGLELTIVLDKKGRTIVDEVKYHALAIKRRLNRLSELAAKDADIAKGVKAFISEAAYNLARIIEDAVGTVRSAVKHHMLPSMPKEETPPIRVESSEDELSASCMDRPDSETAQEHEPCTCG
jgi:transcriptional regulator with XRE-family HTH domain